MLTFEWKFYIKYYFFLFCEKIKFNFLTLFSLFCWMNIFFNFIILSFNYLRWFVLFSMSIQLLAWFNCLASNGHAASALRIPNVFFLTLSTNYSLMIIILFHIAALPNQNQAKRIGVLKMFQKTRNQVFFTFILDQTRTQGGFQPTDR